MMSSESEAVAASSHMIVLYICYSVLDTYHRANLLLYEVDLRGQ